MKQFGTTAKLALASLETGQMAGTLGDQVEGDKKGANYYIVAPKVPDAKDVTLANGNVAEYQTSIDAFIPTTDAIKTVQDILEAIYPIGAVYTNATSSTNPNTVFGFGTWTPYGEGRVIIGHSASDSDYDTPGITGGAKSRVITQGQMPAHSHTFVSDDTSVQLNNKDWTGSRNGNGGFSGGQHVNTVTQTQVAGSSSPFTVVQPFIVAYAWTRTA